MDENKKYLTSISEHTRDCCEQLDELAGILNTRPFSKVEYKAVERLLQVLIEAGIGFAKNWVKYSQKTVAINAYDNFQKLYELQLIDPKTLSEWKSIIGLRNVLVHDYLNVDPSVLKNILKKRSYQMIERFVQDGIKKW